MKQEKREKISILEYFQKLEPIPPLAMYKAFLLKHGVDCDYNLGEQSCLKGMKTKYRIKHHLVKNGKLIDASKDTSIIPSELLLEKNGKRTLSRVSYNPRSPLKLMANEKELYLVDTSIDQLIDVKVYPVKKRKYSEMKIPPGRSAVEGTPLQDYVQVIGIDRVGVLAYSGCIHWLEGKMCKFCDENPKRPTEFHGMASLNTLVNFDWDVKKWWKSVSPSYLDGISYSFNMLLKNEKIEPHFHLQVMAGNLSDLDFEWEICMEIGEVLNSIFPISRTDSYLNILPPRKEKRIPYFERAREIGFKNVQFNLEVIGERRFKDVCPGKASLIKYQEMIDSLKSAVKIFGEGQVRSNFVLGSQPIKELLRGIRELASYGIVADYSIFIPKRNTPWARKSSPSLETIVDFTRELAEVYKEYGFKGIYCELSSRSNILHEILNE
jgi:hypothetical protein